MKSRTLKGFKCKDCGSENLTVLNPNTIYTWKTGATYGLIVARCEDCYWVSTFACGPEEEDAKPQEVAEEVAAPSGGSRERDTLLAPDERGENPRQPEAEPTPAEKAVKKTTAALLIRNECPSKPGLWAIGG